jgi:glycosyltransferase involved in cell wall biosynthesis
MANVSPDIRLLSVVIPVYNCMPVVPRCLDSIDYPDAEIIVVDDGSTDDSAKVIKDYAATHSNVQLIRKENGGASSARNVGIEAASGKYIMFVDADDYLVPDGLSRIVDLAEAEEADIVKYKIVCVGNDAAVDTGSIQHFRMLSETVCGRGAVLQRNDISDYHVVDCIFRRDVIMDNRIRFQTDLSLREDDVFMGMFYCHSEKVVSTDLPLYRYVVSSNCSSTHFQSIEKQRRLIESGYKAVEYRKDYIGQRFPEALPLERLKYMRWVCRPKTAIEAGYSLKEYKEILGKFKSLGCWPIAYNWMHVAQMDWSLKVRMKNRMITFMCNHPGFAYAIYGLRILK